MEFPSPLPIIGRYPSGPPQRAAGRAHCPFFYTRRLGRTVRSAGTETPPQWLTVTSSTRSTSTTSRPNSDLDNVFDDGNRRVDRQRPTGLRDQQDRRGQGPRDPRRRRADRHRLQVRRHRQDRRVEGRGRRPARLPEGRRHGPGAARNRRGRERRHLPLLPQGQAAEGMGGHPRQAQGRRPRQGPGHPQDQGRAAGQHRRQRVPARPARSTSAGHRTSATTSTAKSSA